MLVRDTSFRREGADIHVDVGLCITQIGITREAPTKARLGLVMSFSLRDVMGKSFFTASVLEELFLTANGILDAFLAVKLTDT
ncbi:hypothetical protein Prudu_009153 [Prunus dulcis]|uniref:Uncharacterized protein n=1 Tax=Prunus dulcis TaxID=3755 RepID=A0A4Y1R5T7_PRUDU|nr:hypothetical protein Prudu_009153 [Prunus dulcis]